MDAYPRSCDHIHGFPGRSTDAIAEITNRLRGPAMKPYYANEKTLEADIRAGAPRPPKSATTTFGRYVYPDLMACGVPVEIKLLPQAVGLPSDGTFIAVIQVVNYAVLWGSAIALVMTNGKLDELLRPAHLGGETGKLVGVLHGLGARMLLWSLPEQSGCELTCAMQS
jgi:hypothetical protein